MTEATDGFKWFGEGFDGFPRRLPDDCVEYVIFYIDAQSKDIEVRQKLREVQAGANSLTKKLLQGFIWQRDPFKLQLVKEKGLSFLRGRTNYGDSVEDEWLVVYILRQLSERFPEIWISVVDTDGQFLLIEAANVLPKWLNPEIAENRVWINAAKLYLIPPEQLAADPRLGKQSVSAITVLDAHEFIQKNPTKLLHSPSVQKEAFYRLEKYPQQIEQSLHHALVMLPRKLAYILHQDETCITAAIEAFYLRDPIALRPLQAQNSEKLFFPPQDFVTMSVKFTKVAYAQLKSQQFSAPTSWTKIASRDHNTRARAMAELGMKLSCGFEMLISDPQNKDKKQVRQIALLLEDIEDGQDHLPSQAEMEAWPQREDNEDWLNISFEDFEKELAGQKAREASSPLDGFGDKVAQENLRRMVGRFESFLNDDTAGVDGAEFLDDLGSDEDQSEDDMSSQGSGGMSVDAEIDFNEEKFTAMMREMMGLEPERQGKDSSQPAEKGNELCLERNIEELEINETARAIEHELRDAGALRLDGDDHDDSSLKLKSLHNSDPHESPEGPMQSATATTSADETGDEVDIDLNLARNLLESFKGQGGKAGPSGNLMGSMGMRMPRDEGDGSRRPSSS
ncbi:MAG: hypothetical protein Q9191_005758 [Dirinaria sp. TL-2023a]